MEIDNFKKAAKLKTKYLYQLPENLRIEMERKLWIHPYTLLPKIWFCSGERSRAILSLLTIPPTLL